MTREERAELWEKTFIECRNHPGIRTNKNSYVISEVHYCRKCESTRKYNWRHSLEGRKRRELKWQQTFIPCNKHPNRKCSRSRYVCTGDRKCSSCNKHNSKGEQRPNFKRYRRSEVFKCRHKWYERSQRSKERILSNKI